MSTPSEDPRLWFARTDPAVRPDDPDLTATLPPAEPAATLHLPPPGPAEGESRFGPGVPGATVVAGAPLAPERPSSARSRRRPRPRRRGLRSLPAVVTVAVAAWAGLHSCADSDPMRLLAATVTAPRVDRCATTVVVTGVLKTDGHAGTVDYRWRRSDGTESAVLHQEVGAGVRTSEVVLRWSFDGRGTMKATATLEVLSPARRTASAGFTYACS